MPRRLSALPLAALAGAAVLLASGCGSGAAGSSSAPGAVDVIVTTTQLGDVVRAVGGDAVSVHQILRPNTDPHNYEPRPNDIEATAGAKLVVTSGDRLDAWMADVVRNAGATSYLDKLGALDAGIATCMDKVPAAQRKLVTDHDAFNYFAKRYGIAVVGAVIPSQTTQAQPSAGDLAALTATIRREHVKAIFPESSINPKLADAIARETGASSNYTLYGDTLGPADSAGATYLTMEAANADAMVRGFTGGAQRCTIAGL
jgi:ABC-type Zn uptake system ZnuABC Zn-binding protein ZnuA